MCLLSGRHPDHGSFSPGLFGQHQSCSQPAPGLGIYHKQREISSNTDTASRVSGIRGEFQNNVSFPKPGQDKQNRQPLQRGNVCSHKFRSRSCQSNWKDVSDDTSSISSPVVLSTSSARQDSVPSGKLQLRDRCHPFQGGKERAQGLDAIFTCMERSCDSTAHTRFNHPNRCVSERLGSLPCSPTSWGPLDVTGEVEPYQLSRAASSLLCSEDAVKRSSGLACTAPDGQFYSDFVHQSHGWNTLDKSGSSCTQNLVVVSPEKYRSDCRTLAGVHERDCRQPFSGVQRSSGMAARPSDIPTGDEQTVLFPGGGFVCNPTQCATSDFRVMATRPHGLESGRSISRLGGAERLRISSLCSSTQVSEQDQRGEGHDCPHRPRLAHTDLVPQTSGDGCSKSNHFTQENRSSQVASQQNSNSSASRSDVLSRVEAFRETLHSEGISQSVSFTLLSSWRDQSKKQYDSAWNRWASWCFQRQADPVRAPVAVCLSFLQDLLDSGLLYRTLNVYRSAISSAHVFVDGVPLGQHHLVKRFFKGVLNLRPPQPRYNCTWNVATVLNYFKSLPDNRRLSIRQLTHKLTMLIALVTASRCSSLTAIDINHMSKSSDGSYMYVFWLVKPSKRVTVNKPFHNFRIARFQANRNLCPVRTLQEYLNRTSHLRDNADSSMTQLLLSYSKPYHPVVSSTVARWLKTVLKEAGIDTSCIKAHSTRGASTSAAAAAGVTTQDIMKTADWSSATTFANFYNRSTQSEFGQAVLASAS